MIPIVLAYMNNKKVWDHINENNVKGSLIALEIMYNFDIEKTLK